MTPYELSLYAEVYQEKHMLKQQEDLVLVWLAEYYHRLKKLPSLKSELEKLESQEKTQMSDEEMFRTVEVLNKKFKGKKG